MARTYAMAARAESADATRLAIIEATMTLGFELERLDFGLDAVAERSGRSVRTILRRFGSRDGLIEATIQHASALIAAERLPPQPDVNRAIELLVEHYEQLGRFVLRLLAMGEEGGADAITGPGRLLHRAWVEEVFANAVDRSGRHRDALVDMLVVATDVYAWKLLRLDRELSATDVTERIRTMTSAIVDHTRGGS